MNIIVKKDIETFDYEIEFIVDKQIDANLQKEAEFLGFSFKECEVVTIQSAKKILVHIKDCKDLENFKIGASKAVKVVKNFAVKDLKITCADEFAPAVAEGLILGLYSFDKYKTEKKQTQLRDLIFTGDDNLAKALEAVAIVCQYVNFARDLVNSHPEEIYPASFVKVMKDEIAELPIECKVLDTSDIQEEKMGAILAVARASRHEPRVLHLSYKPKGATKKIVLVGKGLTYDSGGLSLKPSDFMVSMKSDKSGGVAVSSAIMAIAKLGLDVEVHAIVGLVENMIGGDAYKPDDVIVARNGKTIEVKNTDAEGRLVLADCLDYACELEPDYLFDMATLTGACVVAFGDYTTGIMGHNEKLKHGMYKAGKVSGELVGSLPFNRYLKELLKSPVADMSNIGSSRYGGAITAGMFLDNFVSDAMKEKWLHLDIAGPAFVDKEWGYNPQGGSGAGVRLLVEFAKTVTN